MRRIICFLFVLSALSAHAQKRDSISLIKTGFIAQFTYNFNVPGADLAKRYYANSAVGAGVYYKTGGNWIFGIEGSYWFGGKLKEAGIFDQVVDSSGYAIDNNGGFIPVDAQQRGYNFNVKVGKIFPIGRRNKNSGIMVSVGAGYMEHFLRLTNNSLGVAALQGDFRYGYDRLTSGLMLNEFVGWQNLDKRNRINFFIGFEMAQGFTYSRRLIDYDKMSGTTAQRFDSYYAVRFGWLLPIYTGVASNGGGYKFK